MYPTRLLLFFLFIWIIDSAVIAAPPFELDRKALNVVEDLSESLANDLLDLSMATRQQDMIRISGFFAASLSATRMPEEYTDLAHKVKWIYTHDWIIQNTPRQLALGDFLENYASFLNHFSEIEDVRFEVEEADFDHPTAGRASIYFYLIGRGCGGHREWVRGYISIKIQRPVAAAGVSVEKWKINEFIMETMESQVSTVDIFSEVSGMAGMALAVPSGLSDNEGLVWHGAAAADVNLDGNVDIFVTGVTQNQLYLNEGNGRFREAAAEVNIQQLFSVGVAPLFLDYDNDGDLDLFISGMSNQMLFENRLIPDGALFFFDVSLESGVAMPAVGYSAVAGDVNNDGLQDIYVTSYNLYGWVMPNSWSQATNGTPNLLFVNQGGGQFKEMAKEMGVEDTRWSFAAQFVDIDGNGYQDLYISNDFGENALFLNQGGHFVDVAPEYGLTGPDFGMGVSFADYDNDDDLDLHVTSMYTMAGNRILKRLFPASDSRGDLLKKLAAGNTLYENLGDGTFKNVTREAGISSTGWSWGGGFIDLDNDGWEDIYTPNGFISGKYMKDTCSFFWRHVMASEAELEKAGNDNYRDRYMGKMIGEKLSFHGHERDTLHLNLGTRKYLNISGISGIDSITDGRGAVFADFDNDGDMDVFLATIQGQADLLFRNNVGQDNAFIRVTLEGTESGKDAYSAIVRVKTSAGILTKVKAGGSGYLTLHDARLLFGLGSDTKADWLEVTWPSGLKQRFENIAAGVSLKIVEGSSTYETLSENRFKLGVFSSKARESLSKLKDKQDSQVPEPERSSLKDKVESIIKLPLGYYPWAKRLTSVGTNPTASETKIAFAAYVNDNYEIYTANLDGSNVVRLTHNNASDYSPAFSPDGKHIAFISFARDGRNNDEIYIMDMDGGNQTRLIEHEISDGGPAFLPDGKRMVFDSNRNKGSDIYIIDLDGGNEKQLTDRDGSEYSAAPSPDGKHIVYVAYTVSNTGVKSDIYLIDLDNETQKQLTDNGAINSNPSFSPDGKLIAFESNKDGNSEIYIMDVDGGNQTRLTNNSFRDMEPVFLTDGHRIIFVAHRNMNDQLGIFVMDLLRQE